MSAEADALEPAGGQPLGTPAPRGRAAIAFARLLSPSRVELLAVIVMSITAILTAWSGFQSTKWSGIQSSNYTQAGAARVESTRASTQAGHRLTLDASAYIAWAQALVDGNDALATFAHDRFRDELLVAADAWLALDPLDNSDAPPTPFDMPEYRIPSAERAELLSEQSDELMSKAVRAGGRSENYVLSTVYFAVVLFFAAMATKLVSPRNQRLMLSFALAGLILGVAVILTLPITI